MRDRYYIDEAGKLFAVAELPTQLIHELLTGPLILHDPEIGESEENVRERLRIELTARGLEGRL